MRRTAIGPFRGATLAAWLVAGCALLPSAPTTTEVRIEGASGDRIVECRGQGAISEEACLDWGGQALAELSPVLVRDIARLVLTDRPGAGRCIADLHDAAGAIYASTDVDCR
ncbi:MAG: hypothetical protein ACLGIJ_14025 [Candidatus Limnocylindria bacterium]